MEIWQLYLLTTLPIFGKGLGVMGFIVTLVGGGFMVASSAAWAKEEEHLQERFTKRGRTMLLAGISLFLAAGAIPSERGMMTIVGGYFATNIENIEKLPPNLVNAANKFLEEYSKKESSDQ